MFKKTFVCLLLLPLLLSVFVFAAKVKPKPVKPAYAGCIPPVANAFPLPASKSSATVKLSIGTPREVYEAMGKLTQKQRKRLFIGLSASDRSELWKIHFAEVLKDKTLNDDQRNYVAYLTTYVSKTENMSRVPPTYLRDEAIRVFGLQQAYLLVAVVGQNTEGATQKFNYLIPGQYEYEVDCGCSTVSNWCSGEKPACRGGNGGCVETIIGCGTLLANPCNGYCYYF